MNNSKYTTNDQIWTMKCIWQFNEISPRKIHSNLKYKYGSKNYVNVKLSQREYATSKSCYDNIKHSYN